MGILDRLLEEILIRIAEDFERTVDPVAERLAAILIANARWDHLAAILLVVLLTGTVLALIMATHVATKRFAGRSTRVFISFQHEHELLAESLFAEMRSAGLSPSKLPFVEHPDHDSLLDEIQKAIRNCDVFICVPGSRPSFVENEVSMAFGLEKPMLFILPTLDLPRLPNTAKKGYPIFSLDRLQQDLFRTLVKFCSFLSNDWRSTVRLYQAVLIFTATCQFLVVPIYFLTLIVISVGRLSGWKVVDPHATAEMRFITDPVVLCFVASYLALFLFLNTLYLRQRLSFRSKIKHAISSKTFSASFIPKQLEFSLNGEDLLKLLYVEDLLAEHEAKQTKRVDFERIVSGIPNEPD